VTIMVKEFFEAKTIAVIGASHQKGKIGYTIFENLLKKFKGRVFPVNVKTQPILGQKVYSSVLEIEEKIDLAVVCVPASAVPDVLEACGKKGIKNIVIISGGFSEIGEKGAQLTEEVVKLKQRYGFRIIGPNVIGIYDPSTGLDSIFFSDEQIKKPKEGNVSILSQSGTVGALLLDALAKENVGVSKFVSYGNALDINESDLIEYYTAHKKTKIISGFIESVRNGKKFLEVCKKSNKVMILLKGGKTGEGAKATSSHTSSLAGDYTVYKGVFSQMGIIEAETWEDLIDFAKVFSFQRLPKGNRLAIVTNGGGFGVLAADTASTYDLRLPEPSLKLKKRLMKVLPVYASVKNPIDLTGDADPSRWGKALKILSASNEFDMFLLLVLMQTPMMNESIIESIKVVKQPLAVCMTGTGTESVKKALEGYKIPVFPSPERAVKALAQLYKRFKFIQNK